MKKIKIDYDSIEYGSPHNLVVEHNAPEILTMHDNFTLEDVLEKIQDYVGLDYNDWSELILTGVEYEILT